MFEYWGLFVAFVEGRRGAPLSQAVRDVELSARFGRQKDKSASAFFAGCPPYAFMIVGVYGESIPQFT